MTLPRLLLALCITALAARVALAEDDAVLAARRQFERGEKLYALARFSEALDAYQQAFDAKPLPGFLFNIGQCYRNLGDYDAAVFSFRTYLKLAPEAPNHERVERLIGELEARRDRRHIRELGPTSVSVPDAPRARPVYARWWFWTGLAALAGAGGAAMYELTRPEGPAPTSLGNLVFGR